MLSNTAIPLPAPTRPVSVPTVFLVYPDGRVIVSQSQPQVNSPKWPGWTLTAPISRRIRVLQACTGRSRHPLSGAYLLVHVVLLLA